MSDYLIRTIYDIDEIGKKRWNNFVHQVPYNTIFSSYEWLNTLQNGENLLARHAVIEKEKNIMGVLPCFISQLGNTPFNRLDSNRPGFGGPLIIHDRKKTLRDLLKVTGNQIKGRIISHRILSNTLRHLNLNKVLNQNGYRLTVNNINTVFDLSGSWSQVLERMKKNRRYEIKRANTEEINELEFTPKNITKFIECSNKVLTRHNARLLRPKFYSLLAEQFEDRAKIFTVMNDKSIIGGYLVLVDKDRNTTRVLIGGIPDVKTHTRYTPSLFRRIFEFTREKGIEYVEFGSAPADFEDGLYRFKESFGGKDYPVYSWEKGNLLWKSIKGGVKILNTLTIKGI
jgi:predicted N-acyltransferase